MSEGVEGQDIQPEKSLLQKLKSVKDVVLKGRTSNPADYEAMVEKSGNRSKQAQLIAELIAERVPLQEGVSRRVLDIASGTGIVSRKLVESGYEVTATDLSQDMLDYLHEQAPDIETKQADMNQGLPAEDNQYDAATIVWGNRFINDTDKFLKEIHRVLKPNGVFIWPIFIGEGLLWKMKNGIRQHIAPESLRGDVLNAGFSESKTIEMSKEDAKKQGIPFHSRPHYVIAKK